MSPVENLVSLSKARKNGDGWKARCPAHDDQTPSLSIKEGRDGCALVKCRAGCATEDVLKAMGLAMRDLFPLNSKADTGKSVSRGQGDHASASSVRLAGVR